MKKFVRVFVVYALVSLLIAGLCATFVWRSNQQHKNDRAFIVAVSWENTPAALAALKRGADPNVRDADDSALSVGERFVKIIHPDSERMEYDKTALYYAISMKSNPTELVEALIDAGADPNAVVIYPAVPDIYEPSALVIAERRKMYALAHFLVAHHAEIHPRYPAIHQRMKDGNSALITVARMKNRKEVEYLLHHGANIEDENEEGVSALCCAALDNAPVIMQCLIEHSANVNHRNSAGYTALHYARQCHYSEVEKLLLKAGAIE